MNLAPPQASSGCANCSGFSSRETVADCPLNNKIHANMIQRAEEFFLCVCEVCEVCEV